ncbi:MAG: hypothetical protein JWL73_3552, partial [Actinomycetia bacterium]|nr:hypothetical protein [Actinomycetes bacterium]
PSATESTARVIGTAVGKTARGWPGAAGRAIGRARAARRRKNDR